ncbi:MAG: alpha/beta hydrolase [Verrucomicrobia bacterium]|nr:alpha/beta hydrolase [Verrucomicrobiota bacterium]MBS0647052.1 alpha/beta hydrolase [Verrucomicrobiota bacterium]
MEKREWLEVSINKQKVFGMLHLPEKVSLPPVVVFLHGFASNKYGHNRSYVTFAEELCRAGIASVRFDFRGSGDSEGSPSVVSFEDLIEDALGVLNHVRNLKSVDVQRIGVFGASLGGTIAVMAAKSQPSIKTMALWSPVASGELWVRDFVAQSPEFMKKDPRMLLSSYRGVALSQAFREQFGRMSAAKEMEQLGHIPLLHMHGESDQTVSLLHQQVYKLHCEGRAAPSRFISYPDTEHTLGNSAVFPTVINETINWFQEHLSAPCYC